MQLIDEGIWEYICDHSSKEEKLLSQLRRETEIKCLNPIMLSSVFQGNLLSIISKIKNPRKILEIGTYSGYSTLCLANGLSDDGQIHTIDKNEELLHIQNKYFDKSIHQKKIIQHTGDALNIIPTLNFKFDIVFIDADKENYSEYLKMILPNMNKGAVLISDNILWHGKVVNQEKEIDDKTRKIAEFNKNLANETSLKSIIIPIRDGISIAVKL
ncbi:O-methyltransferase [bacterium]|nr:O-methyltransferase [bacterium]